MTIHTCHAINCSRQINPKYFMCPKHWAMVPANLQREIWKHYRQGQEVDKQPSEAYRAVTAVAKRVVLSKESNNA